MEPSTSDRGNVVDFAAFRAAHARDRSEPRRVSRDQERPLQGPDLAHRQRMLSHLARTAERTPGRALDDRIFPSARQEAPRSSDFD
jgi:hypothetical protein